MTDKVSDGIVADPWDMGNSSRGQNAIICHAVTRCLELWFFAASALSLSHIDKHVKSPVNPESCRPRAFIV